MLLALPARALKTSAGSSLDSGTPQALPRGTPGATAQHSGCLGPHLPLCRRPFALRATPGLGGRKPGRDDIGKAGLLPTIDRTARHFSLGFPAGRAFTGYLFAACGLRALRPCAARPQARLEGPPRVWGKTVKQAGSEQSLVISPVYSSSSLKATLGGPDCSLTQSGWYGLSSHSPSLQPLPAGSVVGWLRPSSGSQAAQALSVPYRPYLPWLCARREASGKSVSLSKPVPSSAHGNHSADPVPGVAGGSVRETVFKCF